MQNGPKLTLVPKMTLAPKFDFFDQKLTFWTRVHHGAWSEWWDHLSRPSLHYWRRQTAKLD